ncbi:hypothetical protein KAR91_48160 [Candidatus Pacearchaeota archaeon]|nr:hypothetical protein [Candidatus Pacearchaeota archaeon]
MKEVFCDNKRCVAHVKVENPHSMPLNMGGEQIYVERETYVRCIKTKGNTRIDRKINLCSICASAVKMYIDLNNV